MLTPQIIPKGIATSGLLAYVLASKFVDGLPFYRQECMFARLGLDVSRSTMCGWALRAAEACEPIMELLHEEILSGPVLNLDETTVQVLKEPGRKNTSKSYMWLARGGPPGKPGVLFHYSPSRSGKIAEELVRDFSGYLQTDGYAGYNALGEREGIIHMGCLAHVRRKFMDVLKAGTKKRGTAQDVVDLIAQLYGLEKKAKQAGFHANRILAMRQDQSRQIMDKIKALLLGRKRTTPPKSLLGRAISFLRLGTVGAGCKVSRRGHLATGQQFGRECNPSLCCRSEELALFRFSQRRCGKRGLVQPGRDSEGQ